MPLLSAADQQRLRADFAQMSRPVTLLLFTQPDGSETSLQTRRILAELPALSETIRVDEVSLTAGEPRALAYRIASVPAIVLIGEDAQGAPRDSHIRFLGTPSGYEFISLIRAILLVGGGPSMLSAESRAHLARIDAPMDMHVFSTPTCPHCPKAVTLAHEIAFANANVTAWAVEATEHPELVRRYRVTGVPKTVINDRVEILGAVPEDTFVEQTLAGFDAPAIESGVH